MQSIVPSIGDAAASKRLLGIGSDGRMASKYLLEMARTFSIEAQSEPVLCKRFLPWMDLALSAAGNILSPAYSSAEALERRFQEVVDLVDGTEEVLRVRTEWCRSMLSFGLVRWWPISVRERASRSLGPFKVVVDCEMRFVHFNDV